MIRTIKSIVVTALITSLLPSAALAFPQFQKEWLEIYIEECPDKEYAEMVRKEAKCYVCHQGKKKDNHNPYGKLLVGKIGKKDKKDVEKIVKTIKEVGKLHSDPKDKKSPTYDELIAQGKLPGGDLDAAKEEPKESPEKEDSPKE
jgi:hypothetical protein